MANQFSNKFGTLVLNPVSSLINVSSVNSEMARSLNCDVCMETAEKVALITGNQGIQIGVGSNGAKASCYIFLHDSASTGYLCNVEIIEFMTEGGLSPEDQVAALASKHHIYGVYSGQH